MDRFAAILLSRQPMRPTRASDWVAQASKAVRHLQEQGFGLSSSVGMTTWEILTALAVINNLPLRLYLPSLSNDQFQIECGRAARQFDIDCSLTEFVPVDCPDGKPRQFMTERDRRIVEASELLLPISIRSNGNLDRLLDTREQATRPIDRRFEIEHKKRRTHLKIDYSREKLSAEIDPAGRWLIHWTRAVSQPWPEERRIDFYRDILSSDRWPRSGLATLERILSGRRLIASERHMPGRTPCVSFSGLSPTAAVRLMRWRARYAEMSFEPYGVGIRSDVAREAGIKPVLYAPRPVSRVDQDSLSWLRQSNGRKTDWRQEEEYRHLGDLDLGLFPVNSIRLFCAERGEANCLRGSFPYQVYSIFDDD